MKSHCFRLHRSYSISFILSNVGEIFWGWIQKARTYFTYSIKQASEIEKFHVAVVQQRLRNVQKGVMHVLKLLLFCRSRCRRRRRWLDSLLLWSRNLGTMATGLAADWDWVLPWKVQLVGNTGLNPRWPLPSCEFHAPLNTHFDKIMLNWV